MTYPEPKPLLCVVVFCPDRSASIERFQTEEAARAYAAQQERCGYTCIMATRVHAEVEHN